MRLAPDLPYVSWWIWVVGRARQTGKHAHVTKGAGSKTCLLEALALFVEGGDDDATRVSGKHHVVLA